MMGRGCEENEPALGEEVLRRLGEAGRMKRSGVLRML